MIPAQVEGLDRTLRREPVQSFERERGQEQGLKGGGATVVSGGG